MKKLNKSFILLNLVLVILFIPIQIQCQAKLNEVMFDGLRYSSLESTELILSGDSLIVVNEDTGSFYIQVDLKNAISYSLWYSFQPAIGAIISQNYLGITNNGSIQSLGTSTLSQISDNEFEASISIPGIDSLKMEAYLNDTLLYEGYIMSGSRVSYIENPDGAARKPIYDSKIVYIDQPGDRPDLQVKVWYLSNDSKRARLNIPGGEVPFDVIHFYPTSLIQDTISLTAVSTSAAGLSKLILNRAIAISADQSIALCPGDTVSLTSKTTESATYQWQKDLIDVPGEVSSSIQAVESGDYRVKITTIGPEYISSYIPITVDESLSECNHTSSVESEITDNFDFAIFPNPNCGDLKIHLNTPANGSSYFRVIGLTGVVLIEKKVTNDSMMQNIEVNDLSVGMYFLQFVFNGKLVAVNKFVKQ